MPSMEIGRRFFCQVIVGRGLPIAGHRSLTVLPLSVIMVVVSGLIIVGGAEGIKMKYNEHIPTEKKKTSNSRTHHLQLQQELTR